MLHGLLRLLAVIGFLIGQGTAGEKYVIKKDPFGVTPDGRAVDLYTLSNASGTEVRVTNYGGIIVSLIVPDRNGRLADIVLGYDDLKGYYNNKAYFGALIGRYGNRIADGKFKLDGKEYTLAKNNGPNSLHGGLKGFNQVVWEANAAPTSGGATLTLSYLSKDGEEGFPGNLTVEVTYTLTAANELLLEYTARTDKATPVNLTQHTYFNLQGEGDGDVLGHEVMISADRFTPVDKDLIPTGELRPVKGSPFDFTSPTTIGSRINANYDQLSLGRGYDHNLVLNRTGNELQLTARVRGPKSGRILEVYTTEPAVQFYTGNFLDGTIIGKHNHAYQQRAGFCLETQHYPDSPNHPDFPSTILRPGDVFHSRTTFKFLVDGKGN
jgi:aldose 1-epimerase